MALRRFIAGASCPACGTVDTLYYFADNPDRVICEDCGFIKQKPGEYQAIQVVSPDKDQD